MATKNTETKDQVTLPGNRREETSATTNAQDTSPNCRVISSVNDKLSLNEAGNGKM